MKLSILIISILLSAFSFGLIAQKQTNSVPEKIFWIADGKYIDINQAQSGIPLPEKLEFAVVLPVNRKLEGAKFEFKWYRRGATEDYPLNSFLKKVENIESGKTEIVLKVGRSNLKKGWVKVQIENQKNGMLLNYEGKQEFWINLL